MVTRTVKNLVGAVSETLSHCAPETEVRSITGLIKCLGSGKFKRAFLKTPHKADTDPYLLVLLADQELDDGREEQARYLIEAAYEFFDKRTQARIYKLNFAG